MDLGSVASVGGLSGATAAQTVAQESSLANSGLQSFGAVISSQLAQNAKSAVSGAPLPELLGSQMAAVFLEMQEVSAQDGRFQTVVRDAALSGGYLPGTRLVSGSDLPSYASSRRRVSERESDEPTENVTTDTISRKADLPSTVQPLSTRQGQTADRATL